MPATSILQCDDRGGNAYTIATVQHVSGTATTFSVDQSAVSVCDAADAGVTTLVTQTSGPTTGIRLQAITGAGNFGLKRATIGSSVASGTYTLVVRHAGSAAGIGSNVSATDDGS